MSQWPQARSCGVSALSQAQHRLNFSTHTFSRSMEQTPNCEVHTDTNLFNVSQMEQAASGSRTRLRNLSELQLPMAHSDGTPETSSFGIRLQRLRLPCGLTNCPGHNMQGWSDYSPDCVPQRDTTGLRLVTSSRPSTEIWQRSHSHSHTRQFGTLSLITMTQNLSSPLKGTSAQRVV
jgi:hypothetical protein